MYLDPLSLIQFFWYFFRHVATLVLATPTVDTATAPAIGVNKLNMFG